MRLYNTLLVLNICEESLMCRIRFHKNNDKRVHDLPDFLGIPVYSITRNDAEILELTYACADRLAS
ncbi:hypothetical protein D3C85_1889040 [compost metagenome]